MLDVTAVNPPETLDNLDSLSSFLAEFIPEAKPVPNPIKVELSEIPLSLWAYLPSFLAFLSVK